MGSFAKLARRAVETDAPVMVKVIDGVLLPRQNCILIPSFLVLVSDDGVPLFRYKSCFEGPRT